MIRSPIAAVFALALGAPALAQEGDVPVGPRDFVSAGAAVLPDYTGSDEYRFLPFLAARFEIAGIQFQTEGPGLAATLHESGPVELGVYARAYGGRDDDVDDPVVRLLPQIDTAAVLGGFVRLEVADQVLTEYDSVSLTARAGGDVTGTFDGAIWTAELSYATPLSRTSFAALGLSLTGVSEDYADLHFSIDPAGAAASGLSIFDAGAGVRDASLNLIVDYGVTPNWSVTTILGYSRLLGDFADSPVVSVRGSADQVFAGIGLGRKF